ncbi:uncharacterized protein LOC131155565 isoform X2 [Malania oleifera]|uniref:uncharacterized protein LOC131155565 isoform X2 n=1 Tax=Malania oleifera TaxID=397392 RepID=UPI0025AE9D79|nr:uncharacterized protein LOC131155565 isoform X2 [Malania oleifera]
MATAIRNPNPNLTRFTSSPGFRPQLPYMLHFKSTLFRSRFSEKLSSFSSWKWRTSRQEPVFLSNSSRIPASHSFDVVVIGAGIIGLTIARQLLMGSDLSVAVVDAAVPCSGGGATGAGSMLVGRNLEESVMLERRVKQLCEAGLRAEFLSSSDLLLKEPALKVGIASGAAFLPDDCQLDALRTVAFLEQANRHFTSEGRYAEFYYNPVTRLLRSGCSGEVEAVQTSKNTLYSKKAVVVAAGCWTGSLMNDLIRGSDIVLDVPVKPRKGHLLVLENLNFQVNHGLMEVGYVDHQIATMRSSNLASGNHDQALSISMTATMDSMGNLLLGSSRQFAGFSTESEETIIHHIWERAGEFFPTLRGIPLKNFIQSRKVRVGLRPYMPDGKPVIGPVPGFSNVFLAAGHEGEGLSMALGTAEIVADMVLGNPGKVDWAPFSVQSRCC